MEALQPMSDYERFQIHWAEEASGEQDAFMAMSLQSLLDRVKARDFGKYYSLWPAISSKASLGEAGWVLFDVLRSQVDYLVRYHCADALIKIAGETLAEWKPERLSGEEAFP